MEFIDAATKIVALLSGLLSLGVSVVILVRVGAIKHKATRIENKATQIEKQTNGALELARSLAKAQGIAETTAMYESERNSG